MRGYDWCVYLLRIMLMCFIKRLWRFDCVWFFVVFWNNFYLFYLGIGCERMFGKLLKDDGKFGDIVGIMVLYNVLLIFLWRRIYLCNYFLESCLCFLFFFMFFFCLVLLILWIWVIYFYWVFDLNIVKCGSLCRSWIFFFFLIYLFVFNI